MESPIGVMQCIFGSLGNCNAEPNEYQQTRHHKNAIIAMMAIDISTEQSPDECAYELR